jgi:TPR repeat protein
MTKVSVVCAMLIALGCGKKSSGSAKAAAASSSAATSAALKPCDDPAKCCDAGDGAWCLKLGYQTKDLAGKVVLFDKACDHGSFEGCAQAGQAARDGSGETKDLKKALGLLTKACDGKDPDGCNLLAYVYKKADGVPKDEKKSVELFQKSCDYGGKFGCGSLGDAYEHGAGVKADLAKAKELYAKACQMKDDQSCQDADRLNGKKPTQAAAAPDDDNGPSGDENSSKAETDDEKKARECKDQCIYCQICDGECVNINEDNNNCGHCGEVCGEGDTMFEDWHCTSGMCAHGGNRPSE